MYFILASRIKIKQTKPESGDNKNIQKLKKKDTKMCLYWLLEN